VWWGEMVTPGKMCDGMEQAVVVRPHAVGFGDEAVGCQVVASISEIAWLPSGCESLSRAK
jgi:hypothetical protein